MPKITRQSTTAPKKAGAIQSGWDIVDWLRLLVYGESGSGKTTFWGSFPGKLFVALCSGSSRPGELKSIDTPENRKRIVARVLTSTSQIEEMMAEARDVGAAAFVLDHASGMQDLTLKEVLGLDELPAQKGWGLATQQQYGQSSLMCKELFRAMLGLPMHVVIVAQQRTFGNEDAGGGDILAPTVGAALSPSVAGWLNPACDYVVQAFKRPRMETSTVKVAGKETKTSKRGKGVEYCLRTEPHDVFMTKFRLPKGKALPSVIVDPTFDKLTALIRG